METEEILVAIQNAAETIAAPNWADIASVGLSLLAVVVAGFVAWKQFKISNKQNEIVLKQAEITEKQNKITLFEKRYEVYLTVNKILEAAEDMSIVKGIDDILDVFARKFSKWKWPNRREKNIDYLWMPALMEVLNELAQAEFLFSQEIYESITDLKTGLMYFVSYTYLADENEELDEKRAYFCKAAENFKNKNVLDKMRIDLQLQSIKL